MNPHISESRTYMVMCNKTRFDGYYFRKFTLPESIENNSDRAAFYFLTEIDLYACVVQVIVWEDFQDVKEVSDKTKLCWVHYECMKKDFAYHETKFDPDLFERISIKRHRECSECMAPMNKYASMENVA